MRTTTVLKHFSAHLAGGLSWFRRRAWRQHALEIVLGLALLVRFRSLSGMASQVSDRSSDGLQHFLHDSPWNPYEFALAQCGQTAAQVNPCGGPVRLIIDDTPVARNGKRIEGLGIHHSAKGLVKGLCAVTSCVQSGAGLLSWAVLGYRPKDGCPKGEFRSKVQLAMRILQWALLLKGEVTVLLDSWYACKSILNLIALYRWRYVVALKNNRRVRTGGKTVRVSTLAKGLRHGVTVRLSKRRRVRVAKFIADLPGIGTVAIFVTEVNGAVKYLASNDLALTPQEAVHEYAARWQIETFHRDIKQHLGFGELWMRSWLAVQRHWTLCLLAYNTLKLWNSSLPSRCRRQTMGGILRAFRRSIMPSRAGRWLEQHLCAA